MWLGIDDLIALVCVITYSVSCNVVYWNGGELIQLSTIVARTFEASSISRWDSTFLTSCHGVSLSHM